MSITQMLPILLTTIFISAGLTKVLGMKFQRKEFRHWHFPPWMLYAIGMVEILIGILLCFDEMIYFGAILGCGIMMGAVVILWVSDENKRSTIPLILLALCGYQIWQMAPGTSGAWTLFGIIAFCLAVAMLLWFYPPTPMNQHGEQEQIGENCTVTHCFQEVLGVRYHYVAAGNKENPTVVMIHGFPESWYCFHSQIAALSEEYYVLAIDLKPYGQTAKDLDGDHSFEHMAEEIKCLLDQIGVDKFHLIGHDRGAVASDHVLSKAGMQERVLTYVRMQQSFHEPHGKPEPPHKLMGSFLGSLAFRLRFSMWWAYKKSPYTKLSIPSKVVNRISEEFRFRHTALAVPKSFKITSFAKELSDRKELLFSYMTMPVLILQGRYDPGQHPKEYEHSHTIIPNARVQFVEAGHFFHVEAPEVTSEIFLDFIGEHEMKRTM
ncbi:MAG: alpha/beta fold hydrolase [Bacteroidota bacterium]